MLILTLLMSGLLHASVPLLFEDHGGTFITRSSQAELRLDARVSISSAKERYSIEFPGARPAARPQGERRHPAKLNYYRGNERIENVPGYEAVRYRDLYRGIDLLYHGDSGSLEYDFTVAPGADSRAIALRFRDAGPLRLSEEGDLLIGSTRHKRPVAYQQINGKRRDVPAWFRIEGDRVGFVVARYDRSRPLVIDPVLGFATVVSSNSTSSTPVYAVDSQGNVYYASTLIVSQYISQDSDVVLVKLDGEGRLVYRTVLGGFLPDLASAAVADASGNLFVAGTANSANFPVSVSPCSGLSQDIFVSKLNSAGTLVASRCIGGSSTDSVTNLMLAPDGVVLAGQSLSFDFPASAGAFQTQRRGAAGSNAGVIAKFSLTTLATLFSTYVTGSGETTVTQAGVDGSGAVFVSGVTIPHGYPLTAGALLLEPPETVSTGSPMWYLARLNASGSALVYGTLLNFNTSSPLKLAVDSTGNAHFIGMDTSTVYGQLRYMKLNPLGHDLLVSKVIPAWFSSIASLDVDSNGNLLVSGVDAGSAAITADALQARTGGYSSGVLVMKLDSTASSVLFASPLSQTQTVAARFGPGGAIVMVALNSYGGVFPITPSAYIDNGNSGSTLSGIVRITPGNPCTPSLDPSFGTTLPVAGGQGTMQVLAPANCTWVAVVSGTSQFFSISGKAYGTGNGSLTYSLYPLFGGEVGRRIVLRLSPTVQYVLTQGEPAACTPSSLGIANISAGGGFYVQDLGFPDGCPWTVSTASPWLTVLGQLTGVGPGKLAMQAAANDGLARTTTVTVGGQNLIVNQTSCSYFASSSGPFDARASTAIISVNTDSGCPWSASTTATWLQFSANALNRSGPGSFTSTIQPNTTPSTRSAPVLIGTTTTNFSQLANSCYFTVNVGTTNFPASGGSSTINVSSTPTTCSVNLNMSGPLSLVGLNTITGPGVRTFNVAANQTNSPVTFRATAQNGSFSVAIPMIQDPLVATPPFSDVPQGHLFFNFITLLKERNISRGCSFDGTRYCPSDPMTRAEMAAFLYRAVSSLSYQYGTSNVPYFEDVPPSHPAFIAVQAMRAAGITRGCSVTPSRFCPDDPVTRGQMATFIVRAKQQTDNFPYTGTPYFTDVPTDHIFFKYIQVLKELGVTAGCGASTYCPDLPNTRAEMSAFVVRAFLTP